MVWYILVVAISLLVYVPHIHITINAKHSHGVPVG